MPIPTAVSLYTVILAVHIAAVVIAFGVTFTYALIDSFVRRVEPRWMPAVHHIQEYVGKRIISGGMLIVLGAGIYLASKLHVWSDFYVQWGIGAILVLGGMGGMFFGPREKRLAELAQRDIDAAGQGPVTFSAEYEAQSRILAAGGLIADLLVLATIYFMTAQTGA